MRYAILVVLVITTNAAAQKSSDRYVITKHEPADKGVAVTLARNRDTMRLHVRPWGTDKNCTDALAKGDTVKVHDPGALKVEFVHIKTGDICTGTRERLYTVEGARKPSALPGSRRVWKRDASKDLMDPTKAESFERRDLVYQELVVSDGRESFKMFAIPVFGGLSKAHLDYDCVFRRGDVLAVYELQHSMVRTGAVGFFHRATATYDECSVATDLSKLLVETMPAIVHDDEPLVPTADDP